MVAITMATACRCPPDREPIFTWSLSSNPSFRIRQLVAVFLHPLAVDRRGQAEGLALVVRQRKIFQNGQAGAGAHGGILIHPANAAYAANIPSLPVISLPPMETLPPSTGREPQMMFRSEVFPLPLLPTTETNCPSCTVQVKILKKRGFR